MRIATLSDAAHLLAPYFAEAAGEKLVVVHLGSERQLLALDEFAAAGEESVLLPVREIVAAALERASAALILAHNHPSGNPQPSRADLDATRRLAQLTAGLDIVLDDHLIFAGGEPVSFRDLGLL